MFSATAKSGHHCSDRNGKRIGDLFVCKLMHIRQKHNFPELCRNPAEGGEHLFIFDLFWDGRFERQRFFERSLTFMNPSVREPLPPVMADFIEQNLEKPCPAVRSRLEAMKRFQC